MKRPILNRLRELEELRARELASAEAEDVEAALEKWFIKCELFLELIGIERAPNESMRTTMARALGISTNELDKQMETGDPVHEPLMQAIEREKAAGRWPSGVEI
jgi:hypothetical protein